ISNSFKQIGSGLIGSLEQEMDELQFLKLVKEKLNAKVIRHTALLKKPVKRIAVCGGAGGFLLQNAIRTGADVFITGEYKYHEFFDADGKIVIADVGHFESEQFTQELLLENMQVKFPELELYLTQQNTNPVNYLI